MNKTKLTCSLTLLVVTMLVAFPILSVNAQTLIWSGDAYSSGEMVTGPVLSSGRTYMIVVSGMFWYDYPNNLGADAQYYTTSGLNSWTWENHFPAPDGHSFLQVGGNDQDFGAFLGGHTYYLYYVGTGDAVTFQIIDWIDGNYNNNHCHLIIQIYELPEEEYSGLTPGFWKNHIDVWSDQVLCYDGSYVDPTTATFYDVFGVTITINQNKNPITNPTLLQALSAKGGVNEGKGVYDALARHAVAAMLNAAHPNVEYPLTESQIIQAVSDAINSGNPNPADVKNDLDGYNNLGGGIDAHGNPI